MNCWFFYTKHNLTILFTIQQKLFNIKSSYQIHKSDAQNQHLGIIIMGKLYIFSGAGLSAESGIMTFRDSGGLWEQNSIMEVCQINSFLENYIKVHEFYNARRKQLATIEPNAAHIAIGKATKIIDVVNITTNVDDLLSRSGCDNIIYLHGELTKISPSFEINNQNQTTIDVGYKEVNDKYLLDNYPVKPAVVFFGEGSQNYQEMEDALCETNTDDVIIIVGSSENVIPFSYNIAYTTHQQWGSQNADERPKMHFVNPNTIELGLPDCFEHHKMNATDFFTSDLFKELVANLQSIKVKN
jgi:NAD-dependent deacetylase